MNVYVETNFVLELALEQEQSAACDELLTLAEAAQISLRVPAYALLEPWETVTRRKKEWGRIGAEVIHELKQVARTAALSAEASTLRDFTVKVSQHATRQLESTRTRILRVATILGIDKAVLERAEQLRGTLSLELPDAVMLAAVLIDLDGSDAMFINRNRRDFDDPDTLSQLQSRACKVMWSFETALASIKARLLSVTPP